MINRSRLVLISLFVLAGVAQAQFAFTTNNGAITITGYSGSNDPVVIPDYTNGYPVTAIGNVAFYFASVTNLVMGSNVVSVGNYAFESCGNLTNIVFDDHLGNIGLGAFQNCFKLARVVLPANVTNLDVSSFRSCTSLITVNIPNSVANIRDEAFYYDTALTSVTIGSGVTNIGYSAFYGCNNLTAIYFKGNAPTTNMTPFGVNTTIYYLPGSSGWSSPFGGRPAILWNPEAQVGDGNFGVQNNQFGFNITGSSNLVVVVEASGDLGSSTWLPVATNQLNTFVGTNGTSYFSDALWANHPNRYYRFRSP